ncbi:MAG: hypothetical protein ACREX4_21945 [Gammaproteobacteria bacterium]
MTHGNSKSIYWTDSDRNGTHGWTVFVQRRRRVPASTGFRAKRRLKFSVAKYGEKKAFELAVAARRRALEGL